MDLKTIDLIAKVMNECKPHVYTQSLQEDGERIMWLMIKQKFAEVVAKDYEEEVILDFLDMCDSGVKNGVS